MDYQLGKDWVEVGLIGQPFGPSEHDIFSDN